MRTTPWLVLTTLLVSCGSDDTSSSANPAGGAGGSNGGAGGSRATSGGTSGSAAGSSGSSGGAAAAPGGAGGTGASAGSGSGASGGEGSGGQAGGGSGGTAGVGGTSGTGGQDAGVDAGPTGCTGSSTAVCVDNPGTNAAFLDASGAVLTTGPSPIEYEVPSGGSVLAVLSFGTVWVLDPPQGITLKIPDMPVPPPPQKFQDIRINVPAPPVATTVLASAGCPTDTGARFAVGEGQQTFDMNETCLEGGKAAVFVTAGGLYILVEDISLLGDASPVLDVTLGPWQTVTGTGPTMTVNNIPGGFVGQVTHRARYGAASQLRGGTSSLVISTGTATFDVPEPTSLGVEWLRFLQLGEGSVNGPRWTVSYESIGQPPVAETLDVNADLMPMPESIGATGSTVSWSYPSTTALTGADWVYVNATGTGPGGSSTLQIVAPATTTSFTIPATLPGDFASMALSTITSVSIKVEDRLATSGYAAILESGLGILQFPGTIVDPRGRQSSGFWTL